MQTRESFLKNFDLHGSSILSRAELKNITGGNGDDDETDGVDGKCTVTTTCATGSVTCSSDEGRCSKGPTSVQCDDDAAIYCT